MLLSLFCLHLFRYGTQVVSVPITNYNAVRATTDGSQRTMFSIVWSCLSTVLICAWVSVHPNIPPRSQKRALWRRVRMMFWTIIAPELILAWAVRQWFAARDVVEEYRGK